MGPPHRPGVHRSQSPRCRHLELHRAAAVLSRRSGIGNVQPLWLLSAVAQCLYVLSSPSTAWHEVHRPTVCCSRSCHIIRGRSPHACLVRHHDFDKSCGLSVRWSCQQECCFTAYWYAIPCMMHAKTGISRCCVAIDAFPTSRTQWPVGSTRLHMQHDGWPWLLSCLGVPPVTQCPLVCCGRQ